MQHDQMSAVEIHELWRRNPNDKFFRNNYPPARKYYIEVRAAMYEELIENGYCELIEQYLPKSHIDIVLCWAMHNALLAVIQQENLTNVSPNWLDPHERKYSWHKLSQVKQDYNNMFFSVTPSDDMKRFYQQIKNANRSRREQPRRNPEAGFLNTPIWTAAPRQPDPAQAAAVRNNVPPMEENAERQHDAIIRRANEERRIILQQAEVQRRQIENEANIDRSRILENANREAEQILADARATAERIRNEALRQAEEAAGEDAKKLLNQQLSRYMRQQRSQWEEDRQALDNARADMSAAIPTLKEEICNITTSTGAQLSSSLEAMIKQLDTMKIDLLSDLNRWRSALYKSEYGNLIPLYYSVLSAVNQFERDVCLEQTQPMTEAQELTILQRHSSIMNNLRNALVRALEAMGIRPFTPQPGEVFDSYSHTANGEEDDDFYIGRIIESCSMPGIQQVVNGQTVNVLYRATVQLRSEDENEG